MYVIFFFSLFCRVYGIWLHMFQIRCLMAIRIALVERNLAAFFSL